MTVTVRETPRDEAVAISSRVPRDQSVQAAKRELRAAILRERSGMSTASRRTVARGLRDAFLELPQLRHARCVSVYDSRSTQPATGLLREALAARGVDVVRPVVGKRTGLRWLASEPRALMALVPDVELVPVVLIPALAVDTDGRRLGHGTDHYDQILRLLDPATFVLAAVHDTELFDSAVEQVPEEPHDVRVDAALTPTRIRCLMDPSRR